MRADIHYNTVTYVHVIENAVAVMPFLGTPRTAKKVYASSHCAICSVSMVTMAVSAGQFWCMM